MTEGLAGQVGAVAIRVHLPQVELPAGDADQIRRTAAVLDRTARELAGASWRLRADVAASTGGARWCGPASAVYVATATDHATRLALTSSVMSRACDASVAYATALAEARARAEQARRLGERLVRDRDALVDESHRLAAARDLGGSGPAFDAAAFALAAQQASDVERLRSQADRLVADAAAVQVAADDARETAEGAARRLEAELVQLAQATRAAEDQALASERARLVGRGELPAEDGSPGSRAAGFLSGLRDDIIGPAALLAGLVGLRGDPWPRWSVLGAGVAFAASHPGALLDSLVDRRDLDQNDWGHWVGTVGPSLVGTLASAGSYGVVKAGRAVDLLESQQVLAADIAHFVEATELNEFARWLLSNGGRRTSVLVPGGGLGAHEPVGGHALARHVAVDLAGLRERLARTRRARVSTFYDREEAERLTAGLIEAKRAQVAAWLAGSRPDLALSTKLDRPVGMVLRRGAARPEDVLGLKVVLIRDASPLGFFVLTSFPFP